ncbi:MAG: hypothetical protein A2V65_08785 [Deltaproteobacteria bacterium RBG_13_49_15]|nr:MAG: hypothetical protein A2V65_08785 [Deltaproteobacteria bacterium RBG_13_49_15]
MKKWGVLLSTVLALVLLGNCGGGPALPEKLEVPLKLVKGIEGDAKGNAVIDTKTGADISISITGLKPDGLYTVFFVNVKSQMFEGVGQEPYVLQVDPNGAVNFQGKFKKDSYKTFTKLAVFLNPGGKPIHNPLGVKATLDALIKTEKPKMVLEGKLR